MSLQALWCYPDYSPTSYVHPSSSRSIERELNCPGGGDDVLKGNNFGGLLLRSRIVNILADESSRHDGVGWIIVPQIRPSIVFWNVLNVDVCTRDDVNVLGE